MTPVDIQEIYAERGKCHARRLRRLKKSVENHRYEVCAAMVAQGIIREALADIVSRQATGERLEPREDY